MAGINGINDSNFFGFTNSSSDSKSNVAGNLLSGVGNSLGDYSLIQNGTYGKLMKAYYGQNKVGKNSNGTEDIDDKEKTNLVKTQSDSTGLNSAVKKLMSSDITEENREEVKNNLKKVIESYNSLIDSGSSVDDKKILRNMVWMTGSVSRNSGMLSEMGITIGEGNKLSLDESKFDKARLSDMNSLFKGVDSFMGKILQKSDAIAKLAASKSQTNNHASSYTNSGNLKTETTSTLYDSII